MSKTRFGCLWSVLGIVLFLSLLLNLALVARGTKKAGASLVASAKPIERLEERLVAKGSSDDRIALIPLRGLISSGIAGNIGASMVDDLKIQLQQAGDDPKIKAVVLAIDSPGGEVTASDIIYNAIRKVRDKKPVVISMGSMATSGGYYAACGGSYVIANPTTFTGSIGVIIQSFRYNDMLGKIGVAPETFKSGAFKDMLSGTRRMTEPEREYVQSLIMQTYGRFVGIVAKERKLPEAELRAGVADGRVVTGEDALAAKLVDELGEIEDAYTKARTLSNSPDASVVAYEQPFRLGRLFRLFGTEASQSGKLEVNISALPVITLEPGRAYLLPSLCVP
jgi:protease-4